MSAFLSENLLTLLLVVPFLGALTLLFMPRQWPNAIRRTSMAFLGLNFLFSLLLLPEVVELTQSVLSRFEGVQSLAAADYAQAGYHFVVDVPWIETVGIAFKLGVDGISLWLVLLTTLLTPIALNLSQTTGINPTALLMVVIFGASCGFVMPQGYQTHAIVMGPGGYRFIDYLKFGLPLSLLCWLTATIFIPIFWPL